MQVLFQILMKNNILFVLILITATSFLSYDITENNKILKIGKKAPLADLKMMDVSGKEFNLNDLNKENGLLVIFSSNICPFVIGDSDYAGWEKDYNELYDQATKGTIGMVLINSNEANRNGIEALDTMIAHAKTQNYKMPYLVDSKHLLADAFGAKTTPHVFLFDKDLKLVFTGSIDNSWDNRRSSDENYLKDALTNLSKGEKIKVTTSSPRGCGIKRI